MLFYPSFIILFGCACIFAAPNSRIVGGEDTPIEDVPYQISLEQNGVHSCGGSIISEEYIVTAGHCTFGVDAAALTVRAGSSTRGSGGQVVGVSEIYLHPKYAIFDYDISILKLSEKLVLGPDVATITLPSSDESWPAGTEVLVTGWGLISEDNPDLPINLQGVKLKLVDQETCNQNYGIALLINDRMICAGSEVDGKGICSADSGGPLQVDGKLIGIVSFGAGCGRKETPGVFVKVTSFADYIKDVTSL